MRDYLRKTLILETQDWAEFISVSKQVALSPAEAGRRVFRLGTAELKKCRLPGAPKRRRVRDDGAVTA
jgi:hypothetical protein